MTFATRSELSATEIVKTLTKMSDQFTSSTRWLLFHCPKIAPADIYPFFSLGDSDDEQSIVWHIKRPAT